MLGTPKAHCIRFGEPHALPPQKNDVALLKTGEQCSPLQKRFKIPCRGDHWSPAPKQYYFSLERREQAPALHGCFATYTSSVKRPRSFAAPPAMSSLREPLVRFFASLENDRRAVTEESRGRACSRMTTGACHLPLRGRRDDV